MTDVDDQDGFFDTAPAADEYGVRNGRYKYPAPPGATVPPRGFMRMTNLASAFSDQYRLQLWRERMILLGIRADEGVLFDELAAAGIEDMEAQEVRSYLEAMANRCADRAGAGVGAARGTARHTMVQVFMETGTLTGHRRMRLQLASLFEALERHHLEPIPGWSERRVCNLAYGLGGVMGTLDLAVLCQLTGQMGVLDLKTQRGFWSYQEIAGQQHGYDSARWVWEGPPNGSGRWVEAPRWDLTGAAGGEFEGRRVALLAHMPAPVLPGEPAPPVELHEVALDYGHDVMVCATRNVELRSIGSSKAVGRRVGAVRPVPVIRARVGGCTSAIAGVESSL